MNQDKNKIINIREIKSVEKGKNITDAEYKMLIASGVKEVEEYKKIVRRFIQDIGGLAISKKITNDTLGSQIEWVCLTEILNTLIIPILENNEGALPFIEHEDFKAIRRDMFRDLYKKYIENDKNNNNFF